MTDDYGRATDEELARLESKIGERMEIAEPPHLTEVTRDAIRHWAWATGDRNPLYLDEGHAAASPLRALTAPPCMLYAFSRMSIGYRGGLPGVHSMFGGTHWRWKKPLPLGAAIGTEVTFKELTEFPSRFAGRMFKQSSHIRYVDGDGVELAEADSWGMRTERVKAREKGKYKSLEAEVVSDETLVDIAAAYAAEKPRGAELLYWDDVAVGDAVPGIVRGPYSATVAVAFEQAWGGLFIKAHSYWFDYLRRHPAAGIANTYNVPEPPEAVHWDSQLAKSVGVPEAYDYGPERISWLATMLTNWVGDHGFLEELYCEIRRFNLIGDITYCQGTVTGKEKLSDGRGRLRLEILGKDQRGMATAKEIGRASCRERV